MKKKWGPSIFQYQGSTWHLEFLAHFNPWQYWNAKNGPILPNDCVPLVSKTYSSFFPSLILILTPLHLLLPPPPPWPLHCFISFSLANFLELKHIHNMLFLEKSDPFRSRTLFLWIDYVLLFILLHLLNAIFPSVVPISHFSPQLLFTFVLLHFGSAGQL